LQKHTSTYEGARERGGERGGAGERERKREGGERKRERGGKLREAERAEGRDLGKGRESRRQGRMERQESDGVSK